MGNEIVPLNSLNGRKMDGKRTDGDIMGAPGIGGHNMDGDNKRQKNGPIEKKLEKPKLQGGHWYLHRTLRRLFATILFHSITAKFRREPFEGMTPQTHLPFLQTQTVVGWRKNKN